MTACSAKCSTQMASFYRAAHHIPFFLWLIQLCICIILALAIIHPFHDVSTLTVQAFTDFSSAEKRIFLTLLPAVATAWC